MMRLSQSNWLMVLGLALGALPLGGCGRDEASRPGSATQQVNVICTRCAKSATLQIAGAVKDESWPKECPSCKRWGAYPSAKCSQCAKLVPLMDSRTRGYAVPQACPECGKTWQSQS